jgi:hypothetical protein
MVQNLKEIKGLLPYQQKKPENRLKNAPKRPRKITFKINASRENP